MKNYSEFQRKINVFKYIASFLYKDETKDENFER